MKDHVFVTVTMTPYDSPWEEWCASVNAEIARIGLVNPTINAETEAFYSDAYAQVLISGWRPLTPEELEAQKVKRAKDRERAKRKRAKEQAEKEERERKQYLKLKAKYEVHN